MPADTELNLLSHADLRDRLTAKEAELVKCNRLIEQLQERLSSAECRCQELRETLAEARASLRRNLV